MTNPIGPLDFFVLLEKAFRRRTRRCGRCVFSLPFRVSTSTPGEANWSVIPSEGCTQNCRLILEDLIREYQDSYRLSDSGRFYAMPALRGGD